MQRLRWTLAVLAVSGCSVVFPTGNYTDPTRSSSGETDGGEAGTEAGATRCGSITMPAPPGYDASQLVFDDPFCGTVLDAKWVPYMKGFDDHSKLEAPRSGPNEGTFEAEYFDPSQVVVADGLRLTAVPDTLLTYTAKSGVVTTSPSITFGKNATYIQVRAKLPGKDGMWARAYLGPLVGANAIPVGLFSSGFLDDPSKAAPLWNFQLDVGNTNGYVDPQTDLSTAPCDYGIEIIWGQSVTWFWNAVGGQRRQVHQETAGSASIPPSAEGETLFLALSVTNAKADWHTLWKGETDSFEIAEVQIYAR